MNLSSIFGFATGTNNGTSQLPALFGLSIIEKDFVRVDVMTIFSKILTDVCERVSGLKDDQDLVLFDNCLMSSSQEGLITMLAEAMYNKTELFLVYDPGIKVLRKAEGSEIALIRESYSKKADVVDLGGKKGVFISFKKFLVSDMVKLYSALEYCNAGSLNKQMNIANSIMVKISKLRESVSLSDSEKAEAQALLIANALKEGRSVLLDAEDMIETGKADSEPATKSSAYVAQKMSFYLGLPASYILGEQTGGIGSTGENDMRAVERGLKKYYFSIIKPVFESIFEITPKYKSQDFRQVTSALETIKTFELTGEEYLTYDQKVDIVRNLFNIDDDEKRPVENTEERPPSDRVRPEEDPEADRAREEA